MTSQAQKVVLFLLWSLIGCTSADKAHLQNVRFRILEEATGAPLANRQLNICRFFYFKLAPGAPSPYLDKDAGWYITSVTTDEQGRFALDLSRIEATDIVLEPGLPYDIVSFERSSDLAHTKSADHIRVLRFEKGTTRVTGNAIYDLKRKTAKILAVSGQPTQEIFTEVLLLTRKLKNARPNPDSSSPDLSDKAKRNVPDLLERLASRDLVVGFRLVEELLVVEHKGDVMWSSLRYELSPSDYSIILQTTVPRVLDGLNNQQSAASVLERLNADRIDPLTDRHAKLILLASADKISQACELEGVCDVLAPLAQDKDKSVARKAIRLLIRIRCGLAAPYLVSQLDPDQPDQAYSAIKDLVQINAVSAAEHIAPLLNGPDSNTRYWAMWALAQFNARQYHQDIFELVEQNRGVDSIERYGIALLVKWDDPRAIPMAMEWLRSGDLYRRTSMAERLVELGADQIVGVIIDFLHDPTMVGGDAGTNKNIRRDAICLLAKLDPNEAVPTLREFVRDRHDFLAMAAVEDLGKIRAKDAVPEIVGLVTGGRASPEAILALARIGEPNTVPIVLAQLKKSPPNAHHVKTLLDLNLASDAVTYNKLHSARFEYAQAYPAAEAVTQFGLRSGVHAVLTRKADPGDSSRMVAPFAEEPLPALTVLDRILNVLNYSGHKYSVFIDDGVINVATIPEIYDFWQRWLQARGLGS